MFMKILVIIHLSRNIMTIQTESVVGKMKDEISGVDIKEFMGLKPNMYSFRYMIVVSIKK